MKVINEKDFIPDEATPTVNWNGENYYVFRSNPNKTNFKPEIMLVKEARFNKADGSNSFFAEKELCVG